MKHISSEHLLSLFEPIEIIEIIKQGIIDFSTGKYTVPERMHISQKGSTTLIMPAFGPTYNCTKLVSVTPRNSTKNIPVINGILVLNNNEDGHTVSTMDAPMITALRTAAVGALGMDLLWKPSSVKLGVIGLGVQGIWQTIFAASSKELNEVYCTSRSKKKLAYYEKEVKKRFPNLKINYCDSSDEVVRKSQLIIACTTSNVPVFATEGIDIEEKRFISIGSFKKRMQELPDSVYKNADALIIDSKLAKSEVGDVINTIKNSWIADSHIFLLSDVLSSIRDISEYKNIVFKSVGMAAFDLALATAAYEKILNVKS